MAEVSVGFLQLHKYFCTATDFGGTCMSKQNSANLCVCHACTSGFIEVLFQFEGDDRKLPPQFKLDISFVAQLSKKKRH